MAVISNGISRTHPFNIRRQMHFGSIVKLYIFKCNKNDYNRKCTLYVIMIGGGSKNENKERSMALDKKAAGLCNQ